MFWDFITLRPETTHQVCFLFSDRGIPDGHRHMNGYGSHTFKMVNAKGDPVYCKFHFKVVHCFSFYCSCTCLNTVTELFVRSLLYLNKLGYIFGV